MPSNYGRAKSPRYELTEIKSAMSGREIDILRDVASIPAELLDGRPHACPKCGEGKDRFRLIDRGRGAVLCNQCFNEKNGDAISAVMHFRGVTLPTALYDIGQYLGVDRESIGATRSPRQKSRATDNRATRPSRATGTVPESKSDERAYNCGAVTGGQEVVDWNGRHEVYSVILSGLGLAETHRDALQLRGLSDSAIDSGGYRSVVSGSGTTKATKLLRAWVDEVPLSRLNLALAVPGVIQDEGKSVRFSSPMGLLIPVRSETGRIVALRIRPEAQGKGKKYCWITSRSDQHPDWPSPGTMCHVPRGIPETVDTLRITEGELKADAAFELSGVPTISIPGVTSWKCVLPLIEKFAPTTILIGLDADFRKNVAVAKAVQGLVTTLAPFCNVAIETWPPEIAKGIDDLLVAGLSPEIVQGDDLQALMAELPISVPEITPHSDRIKILVGTDEHRVNDEAVAAIAGDGDLFVRASMLVRIVHADAVMDGIMRSDGAKKISTLPPQSLRESMSRRIDFVEEKVTSQGELIEKSIHPPGWCVSAVYARSAWPQIRPLRAIATCPVLRPDGSIMSANGYDSMTGLFLSTQLTLPPFPAQPTRDDAIRACEVLLDVVFDFPFAKPEHRSAWLTFVLTPLARYAFCGPSPLFLIDANTRGSGKSLLADVCGIIATGATMPRMSNPKDDEECRKRITALALAGDSTVLIDNVVGKFGCASLDAALTAPDTWKDRILGKSEMVELPLSVTWSATGNNIVLDADTSRRSQHIRLESLMENPELRNGFKHPYLLQHVRSQRPMLVAAGLTILAGYHAAGRPRMNLPAWGSFDAWSALVREAVVWCGLPDPGATREELAKRSDVVVGVLQVLFAQWKLVDPECEGLTARELLRKLEEQRPEYDGIREAVFELCECHGEKPPSTGSLGNRLKKYAGRVIDGKTLDSIPRHGIKKWVVRPVKAPTVGCSGWSGGSEMASSGEKCDVSVSATNFQQWGDVA